MTANYECGHTPRCGCAEHVEGMHRQLCDALSQRNDLRAEIARLRAEVERLKINAANAAANEWVGRVRVVESERDEALGALAEVESAVTWALDRSPEACQTMVKESAPWRVKARSVLARHGKGVGHGG